MTPNLSMTHLYDVLCDPGLLNYLMSIWRPTSPWPTCTMYSVTPDYWTTWRPEELDSTQPLLDPLVQCALWPRITWCPDELHVAQPLLNPQSTLWPWITELPDVQKNWTPPSLSLTRSYNVLCDPGLLNYLMSRRTELHPASAWPTRTQPASQRRPGPCTSSCRVDKTCAFSSKCCLFSLDLNLGLIWGWKILNFKCHVRGWKVWFDWFFSSQKTRLKKWIGDQPWFFQKFGLDH